jgi:hypothetical protein
MTWMGSPSSAARSSGAALGAHQVLDPQHIRHAQVRVLALDLVGGTRPADEFPAESCRHQPHDMGR